MAESQQKQMKDIMKDLNKSGRMLGKSIGLMEGAIAATTKAARESNKIVNAKFKTLTETLGLQKKSNEYYKAANNITKKLTNNSNSLKKGDKERLELHRKQLNIMGKLDGFASDITEQYGMQTSALRNGVKQARLLLNPIVALSGVLALSVKRFFELEKLGKGTARESGLLERNTREFQLAIKDTQPELIAFGASVDDISKASAASANNFGFLNKETADIVSQSVKIGTAFGIQADTMVNVVSEARLLGASMEDINQFTNDVIGSGVQVNKVFEDLKAVQGDTALILAGQTDQLMSQVLEARKLGLNLNDIANSTSATGSFQELFTSQMKASVLFGRSINLVESTRLRRQGKFLEARKKELASITGTTDLSQQALRIEEMSVEQKKEFERITGRTASDTIKDLYRQLFLQGKLSGQTALDVKNEIEREKLLQRQLNLQDKLSAIFSKLAIKIGEQLLPHITTFANKFEDILDEPGKLNEILDKTVGYLKTAFGILVAIKGISFGANIASLFGGMGGGGAKTPVMQNLFGGSFKKTASGALDARATRMNAIGSGAKFLRVLGPAAAAISVGADVFKLATTKDAKERKKALGGTLGGLLGGAIGAIGGPAGIALGAGIGQFAGKAIGKYFAGKAEDIRDKGKNAISNAFAQVEQMATQKKLKVFKDIDNIVDTLAGKEVTPEMIDAVFKGLKNVGVGAENVQKAFDEVGIKEGVTPSVDALAELAKILKGDDGVNSLLKKYKNNLKGVVEEELRKAGVEKAKAMEKGVNTALDTALSEGNLKQIALRLANEQGIKGASTMSFDNLVEKLEKTSLGSRGSADAITKGIVKSLETQFYLNTGKGGAEAFLAGTEFGSLEELVQSMLVGSREESLYSSGLGVGTTRNVSFNRLSDGTFGLDDKKIIEQAGNVKEAVSLMASDQKAKAILLGSEEAVEQLKKLNEKIDTINQNSGDIIIKNDISKVEQVLLRNKQNNGTG